MTEALKCGNETLSSIKRDKANRGSLGLEDQQFRKGRGAEFRAKVNLNKEERIKAIPGIAQSVQF